MNSCKFLVMTIVAITAIIITITVLDISIKIDKLIELNQPEAIQLIVPDKPLLEK